MKGMQTWALFVDAYRELNARKMFWLVLILTVMVIAAFAALSVHGSRMSILTWEIPQDMPAMFMYKFIFSNAVVGWWLGWGAAILALISTAGIFPDFMAGGAIDLYMSKPIGRLRLFATKYLSGLLFVLLQVTVFTGGSFLVLGVRAGVWEPGLFLAIPIVVLFFSYLFSICTLLGVLTRSTVAAFFLTIVIWMLIGGVNWADRFLLQIDDFYQASAQRAERQVRRLDGQIADAEAHQKAASTQAGAATTPSELENSPDAVRLRRLRSERDNQVLAAAQKDPPSQFRVAQQISFVINTLVPKMQDTVGLLNRVLFKDQDIKGMLNSTTEEAPRRDDRSRMMGFLHTRPLWWILGSSLVFELVMLGLASWRFCRRDF